MMVIQRDRRWDFVKLVLMFLIVYGHFCPAGEDWTPVTRLIGLCAIPGFFLVSGYFQSRITDIIDLWGKIQRSFFRIIVPMVTWGTIYVLVSLLLSISEGSIDDAEGILQFVKYAPFYIAGIYWFLTALLLCILFGSLLSLIIENYKIVGCLLVFLSPICFCAFFCDFMEKYHFSFVWFFYVVGMLFRSWENKFQKVNRIIWDFLVVISLIIFVIIGVRYAPHNTFYFTSNCIGDSSLGFIINRYLLYLVSTISVIYSLIWIYQKYKEKRVIKILASYGEDTLFVYCSHVLVLVFLYRPLLMPFLYCEQGNWIVRTCESIVGLVASAFIYYMMQIICICCKQHPRLRLLLMGIK